MWRTCSVDSRHTCKWTHKWNTAASPREIISVINLLACSPVATDWLQVTLGMCSHRYSARLQWSQGLWSSRRRYQPCVSVYTFLFSPCAPVPTSPAHSAQVICQPWFRFINTRGLMRLELSRTPTQKPWIYWKCCGWIWTLELSFRWKLDTGWCNVSGKNICEPRTAGRAKRNVEGKEQIRMQCWGGGGQGQHLWPLKSCSGVFWFEGLVTQREDEREGQRCDKRLRCRRWKGLSFVL